MSRPWTGAFLNSPLLMGWITEQDDVRAATVQMWIILQEMEKQQHRRDLSPKIATRSTGAYLLEPLLPSSALREK